jgi:putative oxidoreductase
MRVTAMDSARGGSASNEQGTLVIEKVQPIALLIARIVVGVVFFVNGWEKFADVHGTTAYFKSAHVPFPGVSTIVIATLETVGGVALALGLLLPVFGTLLMLDMLGAIVFVHAKNGFWVSKDGYEFVMTLAAASLALAFSGGGALAADGLWRRRKVKSDRA